MTYAEYQAKVNEMVANPDKVATLSVDLLKEIEKDTGLIDTMHAKEQENNKKIRELQDSNYQMFLRMTGTPDATKGNAGGEEKSSLEDKLGAIFGSQEDSDGN